MEFVFYVLVAVLILVLWSNYNEHSYKKRQIIRIKEQWGAIPNVEYTAEKFESLQAFYRAHQENGLDVDDITWNDIDMDEIFMLMNNTQSSIGEEYLYSLLRKPSYLKEELEERNRVMKFFAENEQERIKVQTKLYPIGKLSVISVYDYINRLGELKAKSNLPHYGMAIGLLISIAFILVSPPIGGILTVLFVVNNIYQYYRNKAEIENYLTVFSYICRLLDGVKGVYTLEIPELKNYTDKLKQDYIHFKKFRKGSALLAPKQASGSLEDALLDYVRMLFHFDLIKFNSMLSFFKKNREILNSIYSSIGYLDSMIAAASFRKLLYYYSEPILDKRNKPFLSVSDLFHPLISEPVPNSINEHRSVLITGSNASGKSTFIKTLAINTILSQTIYTSISSNYKASYFRIFSSMALRDSIFNKESYYMVEIKSLKRILDHMNNEVPMLCFIDEVLRGTNTLERIAASSRILSNLSRQSAMIFAATHDIELTHILEKDYSNYHFQERIEDNQILFDYKIYQGRAVSKNAIKLLDMLKFPKEITLSAENAAEEFLSKGEWSKIKN